MMRKNQIKIIAGVYAAALVLFTLYAALDTFVIPHRLTAAEQTAVSPEAAGEMPEASLTESIPENKPRITKTAHGESLTQGTDGRQEEYASSGKQDVSGPPDASAGEDVPGEAESGADTASREAVQSEALQIAGDIIGTYDDGEIRITITQTEAYDSDIYIADIILSSPDALRTALADDTYGRNIKQETSEIAEANDAVLAINGDFYGSRTEGYVIRDGVLYRETAGRDREGLAIMQDGSFRMYQETDVSARELLAEGAQQVFSFGPELVSDGEITVSRNEEVGKAMASNPRTAIGFVEDLHYVFVVSDGRTSASEGLSLYELAQVMQSVGVKDAYNLDGGGSSTMVFRGEVVNNPTTGGRKNGERNVSDIVYIGR